MKQSKIFITVFVLLVCISNIYAQDWPQYLGPNRNGLSPQKGILRSWHQLSCSKQKQAIKDFQLKTGHRWHLSTASS